MAVRAIESSPERGAERLDLVLSFSAETVAEPEGIRAVARQLVAAHRAGHRVVGVLSASEATTAELTRLAGEVSYQPEPREYDMLLSAGSRISVALCAMAVHDLGIEAISLTGAQAGVVTDDVHGAATIRKVRAERIRAALEQNKIVLIADAQGVSETREITTFAYRSANETAVALAGALGARWAAVSDDMQVRAVGP